MSRAQDAKAKTNVDTTTYFRTTRDVCKKAKMNHAILTLEDWPCSRTGCTARAYPKHLTEIQRNNVISHKHKVLCKTCTQKGYTVTCLTDWPCSRTGCTARVYPKDLPETQRKNVISCKQQVMCKKCLHEGFTLRTPDPVTCKGVKCGKALPRSKLDPADVKTEKRRREAACLERKTKKRKIT